MKLLLIASLYVVSSWGVSSDVPVVTQTPDVSVTEGEPVNITCCWTGVDVRMTVNWLKNQTVIKNELFNYLKNDSQGSLQEERSGCLYFTFPNITREDSGRYTCKLNVEIPEIHVYEGNGTVITVTVTVREDTKEITGDNTDLPITKGPVVLMYLLRCLPIIALISTFFCLHKLGTKARQRALAAPGNKPPSAQRTEEEEESDERETEAE